MYVFYSFAGEVLLSVRKYSFYNSNQLLPIILSTSKISETFAIFTVMEDYIISRYMAKKEQCAIDVIGAILVTESGISVI